MKILLTGASGLLGSAFARAAKRRNHEVVGIVGSYPGHVEGLAATRSRLLGDRRPFAFVVPRDDRRLQAEANVRSCDGNGGTAQTDIVVTIKGSNDAPVLEPTAALSTGRNSAVTSARTHASRTSPASPRPPRASCSASIRIDLPAPVSPVSTEKPASSSTSSWLTMTTSRSVRR